VLYSEIRKVNFRGVKPLEEKHSSHFQLQL
jgi:hypothetical protein